MKKQTILFMISITFFMFLLFLPSCKEQNYEWNEQESIQHYVPACIIWYKYVSSPIFAWRPYKSFDQTDSKQMRKILLHLITMEKQDVNIDFIMRDKLSIIFYNGFPEELTIREINFDIEDGIFISPFGKSKKLGDIILHKEDILPQFYYPYKELDPSYYLDNFERILNEN